jgi:glycosyltransferase involved in cell wall biosynthesis
MDPSISIVIRCHDDGRTLDRVVGAVTNQRRRANETIVVDSGSNDLYTLQRLESLRRRGITVINAASRAIGSNLGAAAASSDYLVFLNGDCVLEPDFLAKAGEHLDSDAELGFVCGNLTSDPGGVNGKPRTPSLVDAISGELADSPSMIRRGIWTAVGGCDERLSSVAELDFWISTLQLGIRGVVLGDSVFPGNGRNVFRRSPLELEQLRLVYAKHRGILETCAPDLQARKSRIIRLEEGRRQQLEIRRVRLEQELGRLRAGLDELTRCLTAAGAARVEWGDLRRLTPVSPVWGSDRGKPLNRYYIEKFLTAHRRDIKGRVLEVKDTGYTDAFGSDVSCRDVLDVDPANKCATIVADLSCAEDVPSHSFDCFILTQVLNVIWDAQSALAHAFRILRPGGVLLCTVAAVDRVSYEDRGVDGDFWRFTEASLRALLASVCPLECFEVETYGNVMACTAHLYGLAADELESAELEENDPAFPLIVTARVVKPTDGGCTRG